MQVIEDFVRKYHLEKTPLAFGVSGGADSLAAVLMFHETFPLLPIVALTVDHGLRPSSADEALFVANIMKKYGIEHHTLRWEGEKPTVGIEEKAINFMPLCVLAILLCLPWTLLLKKFQNKHWYAIVRGCTMIFLAFLGVCAMVNSSYSPYIYGNF